jgi:hypothetical protein
MPPAGATVDGSLNLELRLSEVRGLEPGHSFNLETVAH